MYVHAPSQNQTQNQTELMRCNLGRISAQHCCLTRASWKKKTDITNDMSHVASKRPKQAIRCSSGPGDELTLYCTCFSHPAFASAIIRASCSLSQLSRRRSVTGIHALTSTRRLHVLPPSLVVFRKWVASSATMFHCSF